MNRLYWTILHLFLWFTILEINAINFVSRMFASHVISVVIGVTTFVGGGVGGQGQSKCQALTITSHQSLPPSPFSAESPGAPQLLINVLSANQDSDAISDNP